MDSAARASRPSMSWTVDESERTRLRRWRANGLPGLGARLSVLAECLTSDVRAVADVGADHGQLGRALLRLGRVERAVAIDRSERALAGARDALRPWIERGAAQALLGDGLAPLQGASPPWDAVDCAILAGLGGAAIVGILGRGAAAAVLPGRLVLQPLTGHHLVRDALARLGYRAVDERLDLDGRRLVATVSAERAQEPVVPPSGPDLWIGAGLLARAERTERDAEHLEVWRATQRRWLAERPAGARSGPRERGIAEALDSP